ncbi:hypothetical protein JYG23_09435 [Sedimentibacter sp. zth1]|uniref:hypothetical protein n=1 Tax=Sedimentibacter sp. zth1 TaxID=2816908 RepID=UPI001A9184AE|nr:hypothetical protein [Sedimentibacter sp. zth1]QSX04913.1 hypothetical protein JYG23_09435 [Sedimentibacter sp. zth1]
MKPFIVGLALCILLLFLIVFQTDNYNCRLESQNLKYCADEASASASLFFDNISVENANDFTSGYKIFDEKEGIIAIERVIQVYLKTDSSLLPTLKSYWEDKINYTVYFFDDDLICNVYTNGIKTDSFMFNYPFLYTDELLYYNKTIAKPIVIVTINAGKSRYRLNFISQITIVRSSGYEYSY